MEANESRIRLGFAMCGSFCTFSRVLKTAERLAESYDILPIMSSNAYHTDTRFGRASDFVAEFEKICGKPVLHMINEVEPIGSKGLLDVLAVAPCTGNTLAKIALGITDTSVTLAVKSHLRNNRPVVIAISSNDALGANARNIGTLLNTKNIYFVPFVQDDPENKPKSLIAVIERLPETIAAALEGKQPSVGA